MLICFFSLLFSGGPTIRLKGSIKSMSFLDALGSIIPYPFELWKDDSKEGKRERKFYIKLNILYIKNNKDVVFKNKIEDGKRKQNCNSIARRNFKDFVVRCNVTLSVILHISSLYEALSFELARTVFRVFTH